MTAEEKARAHGQVRQGRARHRGHRGPDRAAHAPHQPPDRAPARAQARPPLAPRPADARRPPPPLPELPPEEGPRGLPLADPRARPAPLGAHGRHRGRAARARLLARDRRRRAVHARGPRRAGRRVLVFYPFAFSPVCTDQLSVYNEVLDDFAERGATLYGVSCDARLVAAGVPRAARHRRSSSSRTSSPRARPAARSASCTPAASRSARSC